MNKQNCLHTIIRFHMKNDVNIGFIRSLDGKRKKEKRGRKSVLESHIIMFLRFSHMTGLVHHRHSGHTIACQHAQQEGVDEAALHGFILSCFFFSFLIYINEIDGKILIIGDNQNFSRGL